MAENTEHTLSAYLGPEFQQRLMWQLLVEPEFAEKTISNLAIEYFDDPFLKRLFIIILEYYKAHGKVPNLQNQSILQAINTFKTPNNVIEEESLFAVIKKIELWNERVINKQMLHDGDVVRTETTNFIKQQEYRKTGEFIITATKNGEIRKKTTIASIEEKFHKIQNIGDEEDYGISVFDNIDHALRKEFRQTIPTGVGVIDTLTGGGLGKGEIGVILTPSGVGKAQPISSKILTPMGWIKMGDIKVNDLVIGSDGKSQKVLGVYPQGIRPIYKIEFNDQTTVFCDEEHLWAVNSRNNRSANTTIRIDGKSKHIKIPNLKYTPLTTKEIMKNYIISGGLNYRIPVIKAVEFNEKKLPMNPYLLGVLIGDGGLSGTTLRLTNIDKEILDTVNDIISKDYGELNFKQVSKTITYSFSGVKGVKNRLTEQIKNLGLNITSNNKFIPNIYKYSTIANRISILQGLLDTDGYASKNGRIQYSTSSKQLADDVKEIVLSLGGFCGIQIKTPKYKYNNEHKIGKIAYILTLSFSDKKIKPFSLSRKQERVAYRDKYKSNKYISSITYSHDEEAQCIYVENDDHLYVTDNYVLTHNTTLLTKIANSAYDEEKNVAQIIFEDTKEQIQRKHFTIWANSGLSRLDDEYENTRVNRIVHEKATKMSGRGNLVIKRFSQENTTMMDIRRWMTGYQKKYGIKFDILVLDYLDCLESHKKTPDRNEAELVIIKSFEALAADFDIPAWTAIQTNRSGFNAEYVEAYQSGGSIKRVQKAHFFMSVAKTADQKEANLASIRIIKARFAQDGQTFTDCIFNNDTMQIIIEDKRYPVKTTLKKATEDDINRINDTDEIIKRSSQIAMHAKISDRVTSLTEMVNNPAINDDPVDLKQFENIGKNFDDEAKIVTMHVCADHELTEEESKRVLDFAQNVMNEEAGDGANEGVSEGVNDTINDTVTDTVKEDILEIEGAIEGANEGVTEGLTEGLNLHPEQKLQEKELKKEEPFEWTGETFTVNTSEKEVKLEDISPPKQVIPIKILSREEIENIERNELLIDPDAPPVEHLSMIEKIKNAELHQDILKKK